MAASRESLPPQSMQRRRRGTDNNRMSKCDKVKKGSNTPNSKSKRQPARPRSKKRDLEVTALSPCSSKPLPDNPPNTPSQEQVDSGTSHYGDPTDLQLPPPLHPLTESNLRAHTQYTNPGEYPLVMTDTESKKSAKSGATTIALKTYDSRDRLQKYGVRLESRAPYPPELDVHIKKVIKKKRVDIGSPSVKNITNRALEVQRLSSEATVMSVLCPNLMFRSATADDGEALVYWAQECFFNRQYVTHPSVDKGRLQLSQPRPDACNGCIRRDMVETSTNNLDYAFTREEEDKLVKDPQLPAILLDALIPYITAQFKSSMGNGLVIAMFQTAGDGTAMCEYLFQLYMRAGVAPSAIQTCHWSLTCDTDEVRLYVHWRVVEDGEVQYHMDEVDRAPVNPARSDPNNTKMRAMRDMLRNIQDYALKERLQSIKSALKRTPLPPQLPRKSLVKNASLGKKSDSGYQSGKTPIVLGNVPNLPSGGASAPTRNTPLYRKLQQASSSSSAGRPPGRISQVPPHTVNSNQQPRAVPSNIPTQRPRDAALSNQMSQTGVLRRSTRLSSRVNNV